MIPIQLIVIVEKGYKLHYIIYGILQFCIKQILKFRQTKYVTNVLQKHYKFINFLKNDKKVEKN